MRAVSLDVLKNNLRDYVRLASGGEIVLVMDRDQVVAELGPHRPERSPVIADARLAHAVHAGLINPPTMPGSGPPRNLPVAPFERIMADLERDRADR